MSVGWCRLASRKRQRAFFSKKVPHVISWSRKEYPTHSLLPSPLNQIKTTNKDAGVVAASVVTPRVTAHNGLERVPVLMADPHQATGLETLLHIIYIYLTVHGFDLK